MKDEDHMTEKDERILAAADHIQRLCGEYPESIEQQEDGPFIFTVKIRKTALEVFPYEEDEEPHYCMVNTEINGDEKGWYEETLLFHSRPRDGQEGFLIEGLYGRNIEYRDEPDAEFTGTYRLVKEDDHWDELYGITQVMHDERTAEQLLSFVHNEIRLLGELASKVGGTPTGAVLKQRYRDMMQDSLRRYMGVRR